MNLIGRTKIIVPLLGLIILIAGCATNSKMVSDSHNPGMTKIFYSVDINASKIKSWNVLADYDNLTWTDSVIDARYVNNKRSVVGMARHCDLKDDGYIVERITRWDEGNGFTYVIDDASDPIVPGSYVIWTIAGDDNQSTVTFEVHYELKYGMLGDLMNTAFAKKKFSTQIAKFMGDLKTYVEKSS